MKSYVTTSTELKNTNWVHRGSRDGKQMIDLSGWVSQGALPRAPKFWALNWKFKEVMDMSWWRGGPFERNAQGRQCKISFKPGQVPAPPCHFPVSAALHDLSPHLFQFKESSLWPSAHQALSCIRFTYHARQAVLQDGEAYMQELSAGTVGNYAPSL